MTKVKNGDKVKVHYHGRLVSGETFDSSKGRAPLEFEVGSGMVIKGFDDGVTGMAVGEMKTINISVDEAYGPISDDMIIEMNKDRFPKEINLEVGLALSMGDGSGQQLPVVVTEIREDSVVVDANHPLAGKDLIFDLELVEIVGGKPLIIIP